MPCYEFEKIRPVVDPAAFVHPTASLIGDVVVGPNCLVGPGASLRGDLGRIVMKRGSNVQDNCTLHTFPGKDCIIEEFGHVGHGAVLHGCTIGVNALVGMNAVIMDDVVISEGTFVAAMAFVKTGTDVPPNSLIAGIPAKVIREVTEKELDWKTAGTHVYQLLTQRYLATIEEVEPHTTVDPDRPRVPDIMYRPKHQS